MYSLRIKFITISVPGKINPIPPADVSNLITHANSVLKANYVPIQYLFDPLTDHEISNDERVAIDDSGGHLPLDTNGTPVGNQNVRFRKAQDYPGEIVVFAFQGTGGYSGGYSWGTMMNHVFYYRNLNDPLNGQVGGLIHELGHYFHLVHTFGGNGDLSKEQGADLTHQQYFDKLKALLIAQIEDFVDNKGHAKKDGLNVFDGDGLDDTPPDAGPTVIAYSLAVSSGKGNSKDPNDLAPCPGVTTVPLPVKFKDVTTQTYNLQPDKTNIMSYFQTCDNNKSISPKQSAIMVKALLNGNRNSLLHMAGISWPDGKIYFFKGNQYIKYDSLGNVAYPGYPKNIIGHWPAWPASWDSVDAAVLWPDNKSAYFFRNNECILYDIIANKVAAGPFSISNKWPGWPSHWDRVDAAIMWPDGVSVLFFRGGEYMRFDIPSNHVGGSTMPISGNLDIIWKNNLDCIIMHPNGQADFFKGDQYVSFDCHENKRVSHTPVPIRGNIPGVKANFDSAFAWPDGRFNFFSGPNYVEFDTVLNDLSEDNPRPLSNWHLPASWPFFNSYIMWKTGIDGNGNEVPQKAYFFRKDEYVQYDVATNQVDPGYPLKIIHLFPNWPTNITKQILSALMWDKNTAFLFVQNGLKSSYLVWNVNTKTLDPTPHNIEDFFLGWPRVGSWQIGLSAVLANWWEGDKGIIYFFVDDEFLKYDVAANHVVGYPQKIEGGGWKNLTWWNQKELL